jgi:hypothetical protein
VRREVDVNRLYDAAVDRRATAVAGVAAAEEPARDAVAHGRFAAPTAG